MPCRFPNSAIEPVRTRARACRARETRPRSSMALATSQRSMAPRASVVRSASRNRAPSSSPSQPSACVSSPIHGTGEADASSPARRSRASHPAGIQRHPPARIERRQRERNQHVLELQREVRRQDVERQPGRRGPRHAGADVIGRQHQRADIEPRASGAPRRAGGNPRLDGGQEHGGGRGQIEPGHLDEHARLDLRAPPSELGCA